MAAEVSYLNLQHREAIIILSSNSSRVHEIRASKIWKTLALKFSFPARTWTHNGQVTIFLVTDLDTDNLSFQKSDLVKFAAEIIPQILTGYDFFSAWATDSQTSLIRHICPKILPLRATPFEECL